MYSDVLLWLRDSCDTYGMLIPIILWTLRCARNKRIFDDESPNLHVLTGRALSLLHLTAKAYGDMHTTPPVRVPREVSWLGCSNDGYMALNVDGSARSNPGKAGFGGLVRNHVDSFVVGFHGSAGHTPVLHVEILGLLNGLQICWDVGYRALVCYSDSSHAVDLIK